MLQNWLWKDPRLCPTSARRNTAAQSSTLVFDHSGREHLLTHLVDQPDPESCLRSHPGPNKGARGASVESRHPIFELLRKRCPVLELDAEHIRYCAKVHAVGFSRHCCLDAFPSLGAFAQCGTRSHYHFIPRGRRGGLGRVVWL